MEKDFTVFFMHDANYLIDCTNPGIAVYTQVTNNKADCSALQRYSVFLSNRAREPFSLC